MELWTAKKGDELLIHCVRFTKRGATKALKESLTWSNCMDMYFEPDKKELAKYEIVQVALTEAVHG